MKNDDVLCLYRGFTDDQISATLETARDYARDAGFTKTNVFGLPIKDSDLNTNVGDYLESKIRTALTKNQEPVEADSASARAVLILTNDKQRLFKVMRGIKSISENPQDIIFASITETALTWTFRHYFSHLSEEHEYMKTHTPEGDPDMKEEVEE